MTPTHIVIGGFWLWLLLGFWFLLLQHYRAMDGAVATYLISQSLLSRANGSPAGIWFRGVDLVPLFGNHVYGSLRSLVRKGFVEEAYTEVVPEEKKVYLYRWKEN